MIGFGESWKKLQVEAQHFVKIKKKIQFFFLIFLKGRNGVSLILNPNLGKLWMFGQSDLNPVISPFLRLALFETTFSSCA